jgi:hypothetical protein
LSLMSMGRVTNYLHDAMDAYISNQFRFICGNRILISSKCLHL